MPAHALHVTYPAFRPPKETQAPRAPRLRHLRAAPPPQAESLAEPLAEPPEVALDEPRTQERPDAGLVQRLAVYAYEIIEGSRSVGQLSTWVSSDVADELRARRHIRAEQNSLFHDRRRAVPHAGPVQFCPLDGGVCECSVALEVSPARVVAVALRLEHIKSKWRATHLTVL